MVALHSMYYKSLKLFSTHALSAHCTDHDSMLGTLLLLTKQLKGERIFWGVHSSRVQSISITAVKYWQQEPEAAGHI